MLRIVPYDELKDAVIQTSDASVRLAHAMHQKKGESAIRAAQEGLSEALDRLLDLKDQLRSEEQCNLDQIRPDEQ